MRPERGDLGLYGENEAVRFLKRNGYTILERNYKTTLGEIDIVAKKDEEIVFVEVKSRSSSLFGPASLRVTKKKKRNIIKTMFLYLKEHRLFDKDVRIDVVAVNFDKSGKERFELIENAVELEGGYL